VTDRTKGRQKYRVDVDLYRRILLTRLVGLLGLAVPISVLRIVRPSVANAAKIKPGHSKGTPSSFMEQAGRMRDLALQSGDQGYGAVIVRRERIVGQAPSRVVVNRDPTAHAEMEAIRDAARNLGTRDLSGCILYSTSRACPMCESAAHWANLEGMRFGSSISDAGEPQLGRC